MSSYFKTVRMTLLLCLLCIAGGVSAQTIKGNVKDKSGEPIIGATILEEGTTNGAVTDLDGNFTISLQGKNKKLKISYVGMKTITTNVAGKTNLNVTLEDEATSLTDIVVIGYGTVRKKDLTGSVSSISAKDIANVPVASVGEAMTGKLAGVNITTSEGSPDADVKIRVRGGGSLSQDNSPLYIVDGFEVNSISDIAPSSIQSIDVLKDGSSTAIYGVRGANGVIIITTKEGKSGKPQVSFNASMSFKKLTKEIKTMDPYNYAYYQYELGSNGSYGNYDDLEIWKSRQGTNYQDELFGRTGVQHTYDANVSGGNKKIKYNVGFAHNDENSIMRGSGYSKNALNAKLNLKVSKWVDIDLNGRLNFTKFDGISGGAESNQSNAANSIVAQTVRWRPIEPLASTAEDEENSTSTQRSPLQRINSTFVNKDRDGQNYSLAVNWKPFKNITLRSDVGYSTEYTETNSIWLKDAVTNSSYGYNGQPQAYYLKARSENWHNANTATYDNKKLFGGRDQINILFGHEVYKKTSVKDGNVYLGYPANFTYDEVKNDVSSYQKKLKDYNWDADETSVSLFTRINYTLMEKYLATFTMRYDRSSKFGRGHNTGYFPSAALAWRITDEPWMKSVKWVSNLKLRAGYGTSGNDRINSDQQVRLYSIADTKDKHIAFNEETSTQLQHSKTLYNPNLDWETTITRNVGIDYGFFNGRINGTLDFYWNNTKDLLMTVEIPSSTGYTYQIQNFGKTVNKGIEFTMNASLIQKKDFNLNLTGNVSYNKNEIASLRNGAASWVSSNFAGSTFSPYSDFKIEEGGALGEFYGYKTNGFYTVYDEQLNPNGDLILSSSGKWSLRDGIKDKSSDMVGGLYPGALKLQCDENGNPIKQKLGNTVPKVTGGFGINGNYKNIDWTVFFNYSFGNKIVNGTKLANSFFTGSSKNYNLTSDFNVDNRYTWIDPVTGENLGKGISTALIAKYGGAENIMHRLNEINANAQIWNPAAVSTMPLTDYAVENASFLRLNTLTIGYTFPKMWTKKLYMKSARIYFTAYNLFCITDYSGYDPEVDTSSKKNPMAPGIDYAAYPKSRSFTGGINITF